MNIFNGIKKFVKRRERSCEYLAGVVDLEPENKVLSQIQSLVFEDEDQVMAPFLSLEYSRELSDAKQFYARLFNDDLFGLEEFDLNLPTNIRWEVKDQSRAERFLESLLKKDLPLSVIWALWSEVRGWGPLEGFFKLSDLREVMILGSGVCYVERQDSMKSYSLKQVPQWNAIRLLSRIEKAAAVDLSDLQLWCDGLLPQGIRVHVVLPPVSSDGPSFCFRKLGMPLSVSSVFSVPSRSAGSHDLRQESEAADLLQSLVADKKNLLIAGATGSGKTTLLGQLMNLVPDSQRIVSLEDTPELHSTHAHWVRLLSKSSNSLGSGSVSLRDLVKQVLRMRADRLVLGECRGPEAFDVLQALSTGHQGSFATIHGNCCESSLKRLALLCQEAVGGMGNWEKWVAGAVDCVVFLSKTPCVGSVCEVRAVVGWDAEKGFLMRTLYARS